MNDGFPTKTDSFYRGQDILYGQFNDVNFYVEDEEKENLYYEILKKLFSDIKLSKIFPLNGKVNVIKESKLTTTDKSKIYLVDKDFDDLLNKKEHLPNLFYLKKYSIENYLLEERAIQDVIIEEKPQKKRNDISKMFNLSLFVKEANKLFKELTAAFIVIQKHELPLKNVKYSPEKYCNFNPRSSLINSNFQNYKKTISVLLKKKDGRLSLHGQMNKYLILLNDTTHIPGKYLLKFLKSRIKYVFKVQINFDSFVFRLAKNCQLSSVNYLKLSIQKYLKQK